MEFLAICMALVFGIGAGYIIGTISCTKKFSKDVLGHLRIDHSEPDEPTRMFVELKGVTPDTIAQHKFVIFDVINKDYISHD